MALAVMMLISAGLLLRSFANLQQVTGGFSAPPRQILTMLISPGDRKYNDTKAGVSFYDEVLRRARTVPGVEAAAVTDSLPPDRQGDADTFEVAGQTLRVGTSHAARLVQTLRVGTSRAACPGLIFSAFQVLLETT